jgi:hypothetical protein
MTVARSFAREASPHGPEDYTGCDATVSVGSGGSAPRSKDSGSVASPCVPIDSRVREVIE